MPPQSQQNKPAPDFIPADPDFIPAESGRATPHQYTADEASGDTFLHGVQSELDNALAPQNAPPNEGILHHVMRGAGNVLTSAGAVIPEMIAHPIETAKMAAFPVAGVIDPSDYTPEANGLKKAFQEHPEEATEGTVGSVLGGAELGGLGGEVAKELPTRANAGRLFTSISRDAADQPVSLTRAQPHIAKMLQLGKEGGGAVPPPVRQLAAAGGQGTPRSVPLLRAMQDELNGTGSAAPAKPLLYPSARNFQSGLASLSRDDIGKMSGPMRGSLKQLNKAFYGDVNDAASAVGRGEDYAKAMRNYRIASTVGDVASKAKKYAVPAALGAAGAGAGYKLARALMPDR